MGICAISLSSLSEYLKNFIKKEPNVLVSTPKGSPNPSMHWAKCQGRCGTEPTAHPLTALSRCPWTTPALPPTPNLAMLLSLEGNANVTWPKRTFLLSTSFCF